MEEWEAAIDEKGRIRIPETLIKEMGLKPQTRIVVKRECNVLVMTSETDGLDSAWQDLFEKMDKGITMSEKEVAAEIRASRKKRARLSDA